MSVWRGAIPYFSNEELECQGTRIIRLDERFAAALPDLRRRWGSPLYPTSVCRTPDHNRAVGGHPRSMHLTQNPERGTNGTMAADLAWREWPDDEKLRFARLAWSLGWSVGLHDGFVHVDLRTAVGMKKAVFVYGQWSHPFEQHRVTD